jgi:hypothetical protein
MYASAKYWFEKYAGAPPPWYPAEISFLTALLTFLNAAVPQFPPAPLSAEEAQVNSFPFTQTLSFCEEEALSASNQMTTWYQAEKSRNNSFEYRFHAYQ